MNIGCLFIFDLFNKLINVIVFSAQVFLPWLSLLLSVLFISVLLLMELLRLFPFQIVHCLPVIVKGLWIANQELGLKV